MMESVISDLPRSVKLGTILIALTPQLRLLQLEGAVNPPKKTKNLLFWPNTMKKPVPE